MKSKKKRRDNEIEDGDMEEKEVECEDWIDPVTGEMTRVVKDDDLDDEDAERMIVKEVPKAYTPTQIEREEHELTHFPYRSWCPDCVKGQGIADRHKTNDARVRHKDEICMGYVFRQLE